MTRLDHALDATAERVARCTGALPNALHALRQRMEPLQAASYDTNRSSRQWCWTHGRWVHECHRADLDCDGETVAVHDPTGEAAVDGNPARATHRRLSKLVLGLDRLSVELEDLLAAELAGARVVNDRAGIGVCDGCGHYCDGVKDNRLRPVGEQRMCNRCRVRYSRAS